MEESTVTLGQSTLSLPNPFFVVATMNPYDAQGTYLLPTAALDRFAMSLELSSLSESDERRLLQNPLPSLDTLTPELSPEALEAYKESMAEIYADEKIIAYIARLIFRTRTTPDVLTGVSSRASLSLLRTARVYAALMGRTFVIPEDIKFLTPHVLSHRIQLSYKARSE